MCESFLTLEKIKRAIFEMKLNKLPGIDASDSDNKRTITFLEDKLSFLT